MKPEKAWHQYVKDIQAWREVYVRLALKYVEALKRLQNEPPR